MTKVARSIPVPEVVRNPLRKLKNWLKRSAGSGSQESLIAGAYRRLLEREPNYDELMHWSVFLSHGASLEQLEGSLKASYDYEQLRSRGDVVLVELDSFRMYCRSSDLDVGAQIIASRRYEPHVTAAVKAMLKPGQVLVDLGANIGYYTLLGARLVGEAGKVIAFEPNARNLELLYASIVENALKNVLVLPVAASDTPQLLRLQAFGSNGFLVPPVGLEAGAQYVQAVAVDHILMAESRIDVVKLDIEGFEPFALRGMRNLLDKHHPAILTEFSPWHIEHRSGLAPQDYLDELAAKGYAFEILQTSGEQIPARSPSAVMDAWRGLANDKVHLDLVAKPIHRVSK